MIGKLERRNVICLRVGIIGVRMKEVELKKLRAVIFQQIQRLESLLGGDTVWKLACLTEISCRRIDLTRGSKDRCVFRIVGQLRKIVAP